MSHISFWGLGGCGANLADAAMQVVNNLDLRFNEYSVFYSNCNPEEMFKDSADDTNKISIPGGGSGRNTKKAINQLNSKYDFFESKIMDFVPGLEVVNLLCSADGGWGAGTIFETAELIRKYHPTVPINLCIALPDPAIPIPRALSNTEEFLDKLEKKVIEFREYMKTHNEQEEGYEKPYINSFMFIDNRKMDPAGKEEFNYKTMEDYISAFELRSEAIDVTDNMNANTALGYKVILPLSPDGGSKYSKVIYEAVNNSNFIFPDEFYPKPGDLIPSFPEAVQFSNMIATFAFSEDTNKPVYDAIALNKYFMSNSDAKYDINYEDKNLIVLGGYYSESTLLPTRRRKEVIEAYNKISSSVKDYDPSKKKQTGTVNKNNNSFNNSSSVNNNSGMSRIEMLKKRRASRGKDFYDKVTK